MIVKKVAAIDGALANDMGEIKLPSRVAKMPNGGERSYETKWRRGTKTKARKTARHEYFGLVYEGRNYKVHRLVCEAFHGPAPDGKSVVIHVDENALNNKPENLRWGTQKENMNMPKFIEYCKGRTGQNSPATKGKNAK